MSEALYSDEFCSVYESYVQINMYYFPFGCSKSVSISSIVEIGVFRGFSGRIWGSSDLKHWWACDCGRPCISATDSKSLVMLIVKDDCFVPCFSCMDLNAFTAAIKRNNNEVESAVYRRSCLTYEKQESSF